MKGRILVIDDNVNLTTLLVKTLVKFDYDVVVENDSTFALDTTRRLRPNLILLDVMMPFRDGGQVLLDLRNDVQLRHIPVILLTAIAREAKGLANQGGMKSTVLSKPIELNTLLKEIQNHLDANSTFRQGPLETSQIEESDVPTDENRGSAFGGGVPGDVRNGGESGKIDWGFGKKVRSLAEGDGTEKNLEMPR